ncbi:MAG: transcriptional repressor LexA [Rhodospirillales bacterium]|nr:transcriptional repressor LexA [Rhodospirillales bacterium]MBO6786750.1 transcriptional repressor LexA [Rhodospirillales bacterium]
MLTRKQYELLMFIDESLKKNGVSPSFDEMKEALGLKSKSGIHRLITGLEERGFIRRLAHRARALEVLKLPDNAVPVSKQSDADAKPSFKPKVIEGEFSIAGAHLAAETAESVQLPLYGRIAAGTPIEALRDPNNFIDVPASLLTKGDHYALEVDGDSMIEAGILDGDTVIIQQTDTAENGAIVVALVDDGEVTLKRLRRKGASIALEPANAAYETRIFGPDQVKVQGVLKALYRYY